MQGVLLHTPPSLLRRVFVLPINIERNKVQQERDKQYPPGEVSLPYEPHQPHCVGHHQRQDQPGLWVRSGSRPACRHALRVPGRAPGRGIAPTFTHLPSRHHGYRARPLAADMDFIERDRQALTDHLPRAPAAVSHVHENVLRNRVAANKAKALGLIPTDDGSRFPHASSLPRRSTALPGIPSGRPMVPPIDPSAYRGGYLPTSTSWDLEGSEEEFEKLMMFHVSPRTRVRMWPSEALQTAA